MVNKKLFSVKEYKTTPLLLPNLVHVKNVNIVGLNITTKNNPGALAKITDILAKHDLNIVAINFPLAINKEFVPLFIVIDLTNLNINLDDVLSKLKSLDVVTEVDVAELYFDGRLLVDQIHFPITGIFKDRLLIMSEEDVELFVVGMREKFGSAGLALLYMQGETIGRILAKRFYELNIKELKKAIIYLLLRAFSLGRYRGELHEYIEGREIVIRLDDNWECIVAKRHGVSEPSAHFERGILAGIIKWYTNRDVKVIETKCIAAGDKYCELMARLE